MFGFKKNILSFKIAQFVSLEGISHIFMALFGVLIARKFGVEFKGQLSQIKLFGGLVYLFLLSGIRYGVLKSSNLDHHKIINWILFFGFIFGIPVLLLSFYFEKDFHFHYYYALFFLLAEILYVNKVKSLHIKNAAVYNILPILIVLLVVVGFSDLVTPAWIALSPYAISVILFLFLERRRFNFREILRIDRRAKDFWYYYRSEGFAQMMISVLNSIPGYVPLLFLSLNVRELGIYSLAAGFNLIVLKLTRVLSVISYRSELSTRLFTKEIIGYTLLVVLFSISVFPFLDEIIVFVYGPSFADAILVSKILIFSAVFLPVNSKFEALCISGNHLKLYLWVVSLLLIVYVPLYFVNLTSVSVAFALMIYRMLLFVVAAISNYIYFRNYDSN